jgi:hypothetical protein
MCDDCSVSAPKSMISSVFCWVFVPKNDHRRVEKRLNRLKILHKGPRDGVGKLRAHTFRKQKLVVHAQTKRALGALFQELFHKLLFKNMPFLKGQEWYPKNYCNFEKGPPGPLSFEHVLQAFVFEKYGPLAFQRRVGGPFEVFSTCLIVFNSFVFIFWHEYPTKKR